MPDLTDHELALLAHERAWWKHAGAKEASILATFGLTATRYYQQINAVIDRSEALAFDPLLVKRLRRLREARRRQRDPARLGF